MRKYLAALAFLLLPTSAMAASNPANVPAVPAVSSLPALGNAAPQYPNLFVNSYYANDGLSSNLYSYYASCPGTADGGRYIAVTVSGSPTACWALQFNADGVWSALNWGVVNSTGTISGTTDSTAFWKSSIAAANLNATLSSTSRSVAPQTNHNLFCPDGTQSSITDQLLFPFGVGLSGATQGGESCQINLKSTNSTIQSSGALRIGDGSVSVYSQTIDNVVLNMNALNGIGMDFIGCQDNCGGSNNFIYQVQNGPGIKLDGSTSAGSGNSFPLRHNQVWGSGSRTSGGDGIFVLDQTYPGDINTNDVLGIMGHTWANYVHFTNSLNPASYNWTLEDSGGPGSDHDIAILYDGNDGVIPLYNVTTQNIETMVKINPSGAAGAIMTGLFRNGGLHTIVNMSGNCGHPLTVDDVSVPLFACGPAAHLDFYSLYSDGDFYAESALYTDGVATDATHTDATLCRDTTSHITYFGSGTAGLCLGTSSLRFKHDVRPLPWIEAITRVLSSKPVSFWYRPGYGDAGKRIQYGFIAEWMTQTFPELVGHDKDGKPNSFDMLGMFAWLVRAFQGMFWCVGVLILWNICLTVALFRQRRDNEWKS